MIRPGQQAKLALEVIESTGQKELTRGERKTKEAAMHSNGNARGIVQRDSREDLKRRIFQNLNEVAKSKDIAIIYQLYELVRQRDPTLSEQDNWRYQSRGPTGTPGICLFCGWGMRNSKDFVHLGEFVADPHCYYDFKEVIGVCYLESAGFRPPVIIVPIHFPGSIDNAILDLAWGLAAHSLFPGSHYVSPASLKTKTGTQAAKLVRKMELQITSSGEKCAKSSPRARSPIRLRPQLSVERHR